jgi:hypothetical protein
MDQPLADVDQETPYVIVGPNCDQRVEFLNPKPEQIRLIDIAYGLAKSCRFQGHVPGWYSTAEHCILGTYQLETEELKKQFLLHDAAEYIFSDLSAPIKVLPELAGYKALEHNFERHIFKKYLGYEELDPQIKVVDKRMCATEAIKIRKRPPCTQTAEPYDISFPRWKWEDAFQFYQYALATYFPGMT